MSDQPIGRQLVKLLVSHVDAWQVAFVIASLALLIHDAFNQQTIALLVAIAGGYWLAFTINDYFDAPFDAQDRRKARRNFFVQQSLSPTAMRVVLLASVVALSLAFGQFGWRGLLILAVSLFVMWSYSAPPLRFKSRPGVDLLIHAIFVETMPYLIILVVIQATWTRLDTAILAVTFLASLTAQLEQQLRDYGVDTVTVKTFATTVGYGPTRAILQLLTATLILFGALHAAIGTFPLFVVPIGLIALPALLHRFLRPPEAPRSERLVVVSTSAGLLYVLGVIVFSLFA